MTKRQLTFGFGIIFLVLVIAGPMTYFGLQEARMNREADIEIERLSIEKEKIAQEFATERTETRWENINPGNWFRGTPTDEPEAPVVEMGTLVDSKTID